MTDSGVQAARLGHGVQDNASKGRWGGTGLHSSGALALKVIAQRIASSLMACRWRCISSIRRFVSRPASQYPMYLESCRYDTIRERIPAVRQARRNVLKEGTRRRRAEGELGGKRATISFGFGGPRNSANLRGRTESISSSCSCSSSDSYEYSYCSRGYAPGLELLLFLCWYSYVSFNGMTSCSYSKTSTLASRSNSSGSGLGDEGGNVSAGCLCDRERLDTGAGGAYCCCVVGDGREGDDD